MSKRGFTLTELLVVIAIIAILAGLLMPTITESQNEARKIQCMNHLKQFGTAIETYRADGESTFPLWLSSMEGSLPDPNGFICPLDSTEGAEGGRPDSVNLPQYAETNDMPWDQCSTKDQDEIKNGMSGAGTPEDKRRTLSMRGQHVERCSYIYEWSGELCSWYYDKIQGGDDPYHLAGNYDVDQNLDGTPDGPSWGKVKAYEAKSLGEISLEIYYDGSNGWQPIPLTGHTLSPPAATTKAWTRIPVARCFWHLNTEGADFDTFESQCMNLRYGGEVSRSYPGFWWIEPGELLKRQ